MEVEGTCKGVLTEVKENNLNKSSYNCREDKLLVIIEIQLRKMVGYI